MAQLTIEIPDELALRLQPLQQQLPELLWRLLEPISLSVSTESEKQAQHTDIPAVYQEVLDFLITRPSPAEITSFKVSPQIQERLQTLLKKNREGTLTPIEEEELEVHEQLDHLMMLLKARAYAAIQ